MSIKFKIIAFSLFFTSSLFGGGRGEDVFFDYPLNEDTLFFQLFKDLNSDWIDFTFCIYDDSEKVLLKRRSFEGKVGFSKKEISKFKYNKCSILYRNPEKLDNHIKTDLFLISSDYSQDAKRKSSISIPNEGFNLIRINSQDEDTVKYYLKRRSYRTGYEIDISNDDFSLSFYHKSFQLGINYIPCNLIDEFVTIEEKIMIKDAAIEYVNVPPVYETYTERIITKEQEKRVVAVPAEYETVKQKVLVKEESNIWKKVKDENCKSSNPDDCFIMVLETIPAEYEIISKSVLKTPGRTRLVDIPAEYKTVTKRAIVIPGTVRVDSIPPVYKTIKKTIRALNESQDWERIHLLNESKQLFIESIKRALSEKGYPIKEDMDSGVLDAITRTSLIKFQKDNNLKQGYLDLKTLKALGL